MNKKRHAVNGDRRSALKTVLTGATILTVLPKQWQKPIINSVVLPAHAQASVCPMLVLGNGTFSPGSAAGTCGLSIELLSSDPVEDLEILSISNSTLAMGDAVTYPMGTAGTVSSLIGLEINWVGQAVGAPFACSTNPPVPVNDIVFTVEFNCATGPEVQTMTFSLQNDIVSSL